MLRIVTPPSDPPEALDPSAVLSLLGAADVSATTTLVRDVTRIAEEIACRRLYYRVYEERLEAGGSERLYLQVRPLVSVVSAVFGSLELDPTTDFEIWPERGVLYRPETWLTGRPGWTVRYVAGYWLPSMGTPPTGAPLLAVEGAHLRRAIEEIVRLSYQLDQIDRSVVSESIGGRTGTSRQYAPGVWLPAGAEALLRRQASKV